MDYQNQQPSGFIFKIFLWVWTVFKVFIEFITILLLFYVLDFGHEACGISSPTRAWIHTLHTRRWSLKSLDHREVPFSYFLIPKPCRLVNECLHICIYVPVTYSLKQITSHSSEFHFLFHYILTAFRRPFNEGL